MLTLETFALNIQTQNISYTDAIYVSKVLATSSLWLFFNGSIIPFRFEDNILKGKNPD